MTDFRMSTTLALAPTSTHRIHEIDTPLIPATQVIERLGHNPTITVPMVAGVETDIDDMWRYLKEPADFFDVPIPDRDALHAAVTRFADVAHGRDRAWMAAATATLLELDGRPDFLVTGTAVQPVRPAGVRVAGCEPGLPVPRAGDPAWLRMAARTTSRGAVDQIQRWLNEGGYADCVPTATLAGAPLLGALVFDVAGALVGIDNPEPTSILDQLERCGVVTGLRRVDERPARADRVWWISPNFETHPAVSIDGVPYRVDAKFVAPFLELR